MEDTKIAIFNLVCFFYYEILYIFYDKKKVLRNQPQCSTEFEKTSNSRKSKKEGTVKVGK